MDDKKTIIGVLVTSMIALIIMYIVDSYINPGYIYKSSFKILTFLIFPIIYTVCDKNIRIKDNFTIKSKKDFIYSLLLGIAIYFIILSAYFVLKSLINLDNIIEVLDKKLKINKRNFLFVAIYISFINSLLEEFFFRGFIFLNLKKLKGRKFAYIVSSLAFAIYHVAIMGSWFSPIIFIIAMIGLFFGGIIFNFLNEKSENIYNSWIAHMMANFSINTIGFVMFRII